MQFLYIKMFDSELGYSTSIAKFPFKKIHFTLSSTFQQS